MPLACLQPTGLHRDSRDAPTTAPAVAQVAPYRGDAPRPSGFIRKAVLAGEYGAGRVDRGLARCGAVTVAGGRGQRSGQLAHLGAA